jgi:hypothetical protein
MPVPDQGKVAEIGSFVYFHALFLLQQAFGKMCYSPEEMRTGNRPAQPRLRNFRCYHTGFAALKEGYAEATSPDIS